MKYLLGLGNYAMGDDGIGLRLVEHIAEHGLDRGFEAVEVGNNGMQALTYFTDDTDLIVIVDAARFGGRPGDVAVFAPDDVASHKIVGGISTHEGDLLRILQLARDIGQPIPPIRIVAIEPDSMQPEMELSPTLRNRFPDYVRIVLEQLQP